MATATTSTPIDHSSDAGFRAWVAEFITLLGTGGALVQLSNTDAGTQIDTGTVNRPIANTNAGYAVFRFDDSLQSTSPFFFRFDFGSADVQNRPRVQITIGTGVNTSGVIQGSLLSATTFTTADEPSNIATPRVSYACGHPGSFSLAWKIAGSPSGGYAILSIYRIRGHDGAQTGEGLSAVMTNGDTSATVRKRCFRVSTSTMFGPSQWGCFVAMEMTSSVTSGGDRQCFRHFSVLPELRPDLEFVTAVASEAGSVGTVFPARPVGGTDRSYIVLGTTVARGGLVAGSTGSSTTYTLCMLYE